jgi:hypothetical protein
MLNKWDEGEIIIFVWKTRTYDFSIGFWPNWPAVSIQPLWYGVNSFPRITFLDTFPRGVRGVGTFIDSRDCAPRYYRTNATLATPSSQNNLEPTWKEDDNWAVLRNHYWTCHLQDFCRLCHRHFVYCFYYREEDMFSMSFPTRKTLFRGFPFFIIICWQYVKWSWRLDS